MHFINYLAFHLKRLTIFFKFFIHFQHDQKPKDNQTEMFVTSSITSIKNKKTKIII